MSRIVKSMPGRNATRSAPVSPDTTSDALALALAIDAELSRAAHGHPGFSGAHARCAGDRVSVRYHSTQEPFLLTLAQARAYLVRLQTGHRGPHWEAQEVRT
ncbi:hypothetical protein [Thiomonas sp.]